MAETVDRHVERYLPHFSFSGFSGLICRRCGALLPYSLLDAPTPTPVDVHDAFHEQLNEMWGAHRHGDEEHADG